MREQLLVIQTSVFREEIYKNTRLFLETLNLFDEFLC